MSGLGYWPSTWPAEDGGPRRLAVPRANEPRLVDGDLVVTARDAFAATMVVLRDPGEAFLLCHTGGADAVAWVERIDPVTLETIARSPDLPGGPAWPGGIAAHANGSLHVVFGNHAHRLDADLVVRATATLARPRPYNSFVVLPDGHLVTKDFGGRLPGPEAGPPPEDGAELVVLDPDTLVTVARATIPEPSVARLSAAGDTVYAVGTSALHRARWDGTRLVVDEEFRPRYRSVAGQTYGWDAVLALGAAWFLDNGDGSERYAGSLLGCGVSSAPLHLVRVGLDDATVLLTEVCGLPNGLVANPPVVDEARRIVVAYDSANGALVAFDVDDHGGVVERWRRAQHHACHALLTPRAGVLVTNDYDDARHADQIVLVDIESGVEHGRVDAASPVQSVLFTAAGFADDVYLCSFTTLTRLHRHRRPGGPAGSSR